MCSTPLSLEHHGGKPFSSTKEVADLASTLPTELYKEFDLPSNPDTIKCHLLYALRMFKRRLNEVIRLNPDAKGHDECWQGLLK